MDFHIYTFRLHPVTLPGHYVEYCITGSKVRVLAGKTASRSITGCPEPFVTPYPAPASCGYIGWVQRRRKACTFRGRTNLKLKSPDFQLEERRFRLSPVMSVLMAFGAVFMYVLVVTKYAPKRKIRQDTKSQRIFPDQYTSILPLLQENLGWIDFRESRSRFSFQGRGSIVDLLTFIIALIYPDSSPSRASRAILISRPVSSTPAVLSTIALRVLR